MFKGSERSVLHAARGDGSMAYMIAEAKRRGEIIIRAHVIPNELTASSRTVMDKVISMLERSLPVIEVLQSETDDHSARAVFALGSDFWETRAVIRRSLPGFTVTIDEIPFEDYHLLRLETQRNLEKEAALTFLDSWRRDLVSMFVRSRVLRARSPQGSCNKKTAAGLSLDHSSLAARVTLVLFRKDGAVYSVPEYCVRGIERRKGGGFSVSITYDDNGTELDMSLGADSFISRREIPLDDFVVGKTLRGYSVRIGADTVSFIPPFRA